MVNDNSKMNDYIRIRSTIEALDYIGIKYKEECLHARRNGESELPDFVKYMRKNIVDMFPELSQVDFEKAYDRNIISSERDNIVPVSNIWNYAEGISDNEVAAVILWDEYNSNQDDLFTINIDGYKSEVINNVPYVTHEKLFLFLYGQGWKSKQNSTGSDTEDWIIVSGNAVTSVTIPLTKYVQNYTEIVNKAVYDIKNSYGWSLEHTVDQINDAPSMF